MGLIGCVLIIIIVACVVALICISRKRKALEDSLIKTTVISSERAEKSIDSNALKEEEKAFVVAQTTIYAFKVSVETHRCPFCDGENTASAKNCIICGRKLY